MLRRRRKLLKLSKVAEAAPDAPPLDIFFRKSRRLETDVCPPPMRGAAPRFFLLPCPSFLVNSPRSSRTALVSNNADPLTPKVTLVLNSFDLYSFVAFHIWLHQSKADMLGYTTVWKVFPSANWLKLGKDLKTTHFYCNHLLLSVHARVFLPLSHSGAECATTATLIPHDECVKSLTL